MLIEYQFKFEKNGFTLTQRIESGASDKQGKTKQQVAEENSVKASYQESEAASIAGPKTGGSPSSTPGETFLKFDSGAGPAILIGPFIMCCPCGNSNEE
jgi:hypothetical protein